MFLSPADPYIGYRLPSIQVVFISIWASMLSMMPDLAPTYRISTGTIYEQAVVIIESIPVRVNRSHPLSSVPSALSYIQILVTS